MPIEHIRQNATEQYADASPAGSNEAEESHRLRPLGWLRKQVHDQREGNSRDDSTAESLDRPRRDEESLRPRHATGQRCQCEERDADQEEPAVAEEITEPTAKQQEAAEGEEIGVYHPGKRGLGETEILPDRGERDVHNCRVEHDHQSAQAEDDQREPTPRASLGGLCKVISERFSMTQSICLYEFHSIAPLNLRCLMPGIQLP